MKTKSFDGLALDMPTLDQESTQLVKGGWQDSYPDDMPHFYYEITVTAPDPGGDPGYDPWDDPFFDPWNDPFGDPWGDPYGDPDNGGGGGPANPSYYGGTAEGIDIANGDATAAEANAYYDKFSDATTALGLTAGVQGLKADALAELVQATTGEAGTVKTLSAYGKAWGIVGVAVGGVDLYYAFSDGDISNSDIINAVGVGFGIVGLVASGPVGWIAGGISLGIGIWSATN